MSASIRVLHVDDDEDIRAITELSLSLEPGFVLHQCASGAEAIEKAREFNPDVLLLDMVMPGMNGEETWKALREQLGMIDTPAIFMSARAEDNFAKQVMDQGATGIITKPFDPLTLGQEIRKILASHGGSAEHPGQDEPNNVLSFNA